MALKHHFPLLKTVFFFPLCFFVFCPTGSSADSTAWPHSVRSGQAPRGMMSSLEINLKALISCLSLLTINKNKKGAKPNQINKTWLGELTIAFSTFREWFRSFFCIYRYLCSVVCLHKKITAFAFAAGRGNWRSRWSGQRPHADKRWRVSTVQMSDCKQHLSCFLSFILFFFFTSGCLTQEKIVAGCAKHFVVIADYRCVSVNLNVRC